MGTGKLVWKRSELNVYLHTFLLQLQKYKEIGCKVFEHQDMWKMFSTLPQRADMNVKFMRVYVHVCVFACKHFI